MLKTFFRPGAHPAGGAIMENIFLTGELSPKGRSFTILNLVSLQIQNSHFVLKQLNLHSFHCDLNCYRKNLDSLSESYF